MTKKISSAELIQKLENVDDRLLNLWLRDDVNLDDEERWDIFVTLLETRVSLLKTCLDAGIPMKPEQCVPAWLERLTSSRLEIRRRELRLFEEERQMKKRLALYESVSTQKKKKDAEP